MLCGIVQWEFGPGMVKGRGDWSVKCNRAMNTNVRETTTTITHTKKRKTKTLESLDCENRLCCNAYVCISERTSTCGSHKSYTNFHNFSRSSSWYCFCFVLRLYEMTCAFVIRILRTHFFLYLLGNIHWKCTQMHETGTTHPEISITISFACVCVCFTVLCIFFSSFFVSWTVATNALCPLRFVVCSFL